MVRLERHISHRDFFRKFILGQNYELIRSLYTIYVLYDVAVVTLIDIPQRKSHLLFCRPMAAASCAVRQMKQLTLLILQCSENGLLLGMKKRGFGVGKVRLGSTFPRQLHPSFRDVTYELGRLAEEFFRR